MWLGMPDQTQTCSSTNLDIDWNCHVAKSTFSPRLINGACPVMLPRQKAASLGLSPCLQRPCLWNRAAVCKLYTYLPTQKSLLAMGALFGETAGQNELSKHERELSLLASTMACHCLASSLGTGEIAGRVSIWLTQNRDWEKSLPTDGTLQEMDAVLS